MSRACSSALLVWLSASACVAQPSGEPEVASTRPGGVRPKQGPSCVASGGDAVALVDGLRGGCGWSLSVDDAASLDGSAHLSLRALTLVTAETETDSALVGEGAAPQACGPTLARCEAEGVGTSLGPVLILRRLGGESEVPEQIYIGWVEDGRLGFAPSWGEQRSVVDHTRIGPVFALAPYDCGGALLLLPTPRLPEASGEQVPVALAARGGRWHIDEISETGEARPPSEAAPAEVSGCRPLFSSVP